RLALSIKDFGKRRVVAGRGLLRVMELVTPHRVSRLPQWTIGHQPRLPVAEVHLAPGEAGGVSEQAKHTMSRAVRILERLAQHHVATAFAVDRTRRREFPYAGSEAFRGSEAAGVQLGIAARQPAGIAIVRRRLVGERRERNE